MNWIEVRISTTSEASDAVSQMLMSIGSGGVVIEDPNDIIKEIEKPGSLDYADDEFLNSLGDDVIVKAYFPGDRNRNELIHIINEKINHIAKFLDTGEGQAALLEVDEEDWSTAWKKYYKPFHISERVVVKPSWESYKPEGNEIIVEMDPGMAFGTGTHDTTRMCAVFLEKYVEEGNSVLDVGCGTGILSIISAKLGARSINAIDIEDTAVRIARENCRLNRVDNYVEVYQGTLETFSPDKADIVVANIIADVIIDISVRVPACVKAGGFFIASGIIKEREKEVIEKYKGLGFSIDHRMESGEWVAIAFKCLGSL